jgi:hypothetical protein
VLHTLQTCAVGAASNDLDNGKNVINENVHLSEVETVCRKVFSGLGLDESVRCRTTGYMKEGGSSTAADMLVCWVCVQVASEDWDSNIEAGLMYEALVRCSSLNSSQRPLATNATCHEVRVRCASFRQ